MKAIAVLRALLSAVFLAFSSVVAQSGSPLRCLPYVPGGASFNKPTGSLYLDTTSGTTYSAYPNNPMTTHTTYPYEGDWTFFTRACNSTSLNLTRTQEGNAITDYVQILNTVTGHCMTWQTYGTASNVTFEPCEHTPDAPSQLFSAVQQAGQYQPNAAIGLVSSGSWSFVRFHDGHVGMGEEGGDGAVVTALYHATTLK